MRLFIFFYSSVTAEKSASTPSPASPTPTDQVPASPVPQDCPPPPPNPPRDQSIQCNHLPANKYPDVSHPSQRNGQAHEVVSGKSRDTEFTQAGQIVQESPDSKVSDVGQSCERSSASQTGEEYHQCSPAEESVVEKCQIQPVQQIPRSFQEPTVVCQVDESYQLSTETESSEVVEAVIQSRDVAGVNGRNHSDIEKLALEKLSEICDDNSQESQFSQANCFSGSKTKYPIGSEKSKTKFCKANFKKSKKNKVSSYEKLKIIRSKSGCLGAQTSPSCSLEVCSLKMCKRSFKKYSLKRSFE